MARVTDRGQALLVGAVVLAVAFLGLALVLNGAIYETTLSTEASEDVAGNGLVTIQDAVRGDVATLMERAENRSDTAGTQATYVTAMLDENRLGANYTRQYAERDVLVRVSNPQPVAGENVSGDLSSLSSLSRSDTRAREFRMSFGTFDTSTGPLRIQVSGSETYEIVINGGGDSDDKIEVDGPDGPVECTGDEPAYVDLTNGSYRTDPSSPSNIRRCPALDVFSRLDGTYDVIVSGGDHATDGSYRYLVRDSSATDRLYQVSVDLVVHSDSIDYEGTLRVAPGEPR